jgi:ABC-type sugar transport system ATPase subunit
MAEPAAAPAPDAAPVVEMRGIAKYFGGVAALDGVDLIVNPREVVALLGDNGAGKSTLIKILSGVLTADAGDIRMDGRPVAIPNPHAAKDLGIETVYQDLALCDNVDVPTNLFLGRELMRPLLGGLIRIFDKRRMLQETTGLLQRLNIELHTLQTPVRNLSGGERQSVAIARSVYGNAKLIIMDEPTAALGVEPTEKVLRLVRELKQSGLSVVFISHIMEDVLRVADRMVVLKNGRLVGERSAADTSRDDIVHMMITGRDERRVH